jgi:hypothetical protein
VSGLVKMNGVGRDEEPFGQSDRYGVSSYPTLDPSQALILMKPDADPGQQPKSSPSAASALLPMPSVPVQLAVAGSTALQ